MPKPRKPRNSNRGTLQHIEDEFSDLSLIEQAAMLDTLTKLHRWCTRERDRSPKTGTEAEAAGRADYAAVGDVADPAKNAALLLDMPEETKQ